MARITETLTTAKAVLEVEVVEEMLVEEVEMLVEEEAAEAEAGQEAAGTMDRVRGEATDRAMAHHLDRHTIRQASNAHYTFWRIHFRSQRYLRSTRRYWPCQSPVDRCFLVFTRL
jgi:hypothetical protein